MGKRFQVGTVSKVHGAWLGRWREGGERRVQRLGRVGKMNKSEAKEKLAGILRPINANAEGNPNRMFGDFVENVYFPFYRRKWKRSTKMTTQDRIEFHLIGEFSKRRLSELTRDRLQAFLDQKAATLSFSTVDHLKWDLVSIFRMAMAEGCSRRNPAELLFTPREAKRPVRRTLNLKEVNKLFEVLELRETPDCEICGSGRDAAW